MLELTSKTDGIAYCGLYCDGCPSHTGEIPDLARDLRKALRTFRYDIIAEGLAGQGFDFFKSFEKYPECYEVLGSLVKMRCKAGCKHGGGNPYCKIRKCSQKNDFEGCWECSDFKTCEKLKVQDEFHGDAHNKNLRIIQKRGVKTFLAGKKHWYIKPKGPK